MDSAVLNYGFIHNVSQMVTQVAALGLNENKSGEVFLAKIKWIQEGQIRPFDFREGTKPNSRFKQNWGQGHVKHNSSLAQLIEQELWFLQGWYFKHTKSLHSFEWNNTKCKT